LFLDVLGLKYYNNFTKKMKFINRFLSENVSIRYEQRSNILRNIKKLKNILKSKNLQKIEVSTINLSYY